MKYKIKEFDIDYKGSFGTFIKKGEYFTTLDEVERNGGYLKNDEGEKIEFPFFVYELTCRWLRSLGVQKETQQALSEEGWACVHAEEDIYGIWS